MKGILFDEFGGLIRCEFDGCIEGEGHNVMIIMPGKPLMTLKEYRQEEMLEGTSIRLLCAGNENASSSAMLMLMGTIMDNSVSDMKTDMVRCMNWLNILNVHWNREALNLEFVVHMNRNRDGSPSYSFYIVNMDIDEVICHEVCGFHGTYDLMNSIRLFISILEQDADIPVDLKKLSIGQKAAEGLSTFDIDYFDEISQY